MAKLKAFTVAELAASGFRGFVPFDALRQQLSQGDGGVPRSPGTYLVLRVSTAEPEFLAKGFGGQHKHFPKNSPVPELKLNWVTGAAVLYVGKVSQRENGGGLWDRLKEYATAGKGNNHSHRGGEYIWQLADAKDFLVAWKVTPDNTELMLERAIIDAFTEKYGKMPFANRS